MNLTEQNPATPSLVDSATIEINDYLKAKFPFLNNCFGKAQKLSRKNEKGAIQYYPGVFAGAGKTLGKDYINLFPNDLLGNYSFWKFEDPFLISGNMNGFFQAKADFNLIFWFDLRKVYNEAEKRNIELLKEQISNALLMGVFRKASLALESISEEVSNVYRGYTISEAENPFAMHPYGCLRFSGKIIIRNFC